MVLFLPLQFFYFMILQPTFTLYYRDSIQTQQCTEILCLKLTIKITCKISRGRNSTPSVIILPLGRFSPQKLEFEEENHFTTRITFTISKYLVKCARNIYEFIKNSLCVSTYTNATICKTVLAECQGDQIDRQQMDIRKHTHVCVGTVLSQSTRNFYIHCPNNVYHRITDSLTISSLSLPPPTISVICRSFHMPAVFCLYTFFSSATLCQQK